MLLTKCFTCIHGGKSHIGVNQGLITKTSYDFSQDYLKLDHKSIISSQLTGTILYDLNLTVIVC